jgi:tRNA(His) guanylyltransferase
LFSKFQINYNTLPERFRKGSVLYRQIMTEPGVALLAGITEETVNEEETPQRSKTIRARKEVAVAHCDIIGRSFWEEHEGILVDKEP